MSVFKRLSLLLSASVLVLWACHLSQDAAVEDNVSFSRLYDTLEQFDSTVIVFATGIERNRFRIDDV